MWKRCWFTVLILALVSASGCWDRVELNEAAVSIGCGLDLVSNNRLMVTL